MYDRVQTFIKKILDNEYYFFVLYVLWTILYNSLILKTFKPLKEGKYFDQTGPERLVLQMNMHPNHY